MIGISKFASENVIIHKIRSHFTQCTFDEFDSNQFKFKIKNLFVIQAVCNSLKSLENSEAKANNRVEEFKVEMESLTGRLKAAEARAENAEKLVKRLQKEVDRLEGMFTYFVPFYVRLDFLINFF